MQGIAARTSPLDASPKGSCSNSDFLEDSIWKPRNLLADAQSKASRALLLRQRREWNWAGVRECWTIHDKSSSSPDKSVSGDGCLEEEACALLKSGAAVHVFSFLKEKSQSGVKMKAISGKAWPQGGSALIPHVALTPASKLYPWPVAAGSGGLCGLDLLYS